MEHLLIKSLFNKFELWKADQSALLLTMVRPKWYARTMVFDWKGDSYKIEAKSLTGFKNIMLQNGREKGELEMEWKSTFTLRLEDETGMTKYFTFKKKSTFGRSYQLTDFQLQPILEITPRWNWKGFRLEYKVDVFDVSDTEAKHLNIIPAICCVFWCTRQIMRSRNN